MPEIPDVQDDELAVPLVLETDLDEMHPVLPNLIIPQTSDDEMFSEGEADVEAEVLVAGEVIEAIVRQLSSQPVAEDEISPAFDSLKLPTLKCLPRRKPKIPNHLTGDEAMEKIM